MASEPADIDGGSVPGVAGESEPEDFSPAGLRREFEELSERMNAEARSLLRASESAARQRYECADERGGVQVTVDGRLRVADLYISPQAMRAGADELSPTLVTLINRAVAEARANSRDHLLDAVDPAMREVLGAAMESIGRIADRPGDAQA